MVNAPNLLDAVELSLRSRDLASGEQREVSLPIVRHAWDGSKLHASDLGLLDPEDGCPRQLWGRVHGWRAQSTGLGKLLMFDNAYGVHERVAWHLAHGLPAQGWEVIEVEEAIEAEGEGRLDVLIEYRRKGGFEGDEVLAVTRVVVDIKSVRGAAFSYLFKAKQPHVWQVQAYVRAKQAAYGILLYVDREGQNGMKQFNVGGDTDGTAERWALGRAVVELPEAPPMLPEKGVGELHWRCTYCNFLDVSCPSAIPPEGRKDKKKARR